MPFGVISGGLFNTQVFNAAGTFTWTNPGARYVIIDGCGSGGGGGGAGTTVLNEVKMAGPGSPGAYGKVLINNPEKILNISIGAPGLGMSGSGINSVIGGDAAVTTVTGISTLLTFNGGVGLGIDSSGGFPVILGKTFKAILTNNFQFASGEILYNPLPLNSFAAYTQLVLDAGAVNTFVIDSSPQRLYAYSPFGLTGGVTLNGNGASPFGNGGGGNGTMNAQSQVTVRTGGNGTPGIIRIYSYR